MASQTGSNVDTRFDFTGQERDEGTGLMYFGARYYDPVIGRFLSVDPLKDKYPTLSPYNYTANNPLKFVDSDGKAISVAIGGGIVVGAGELTVLAIGSIAALAATADLDGTAEALQGISNAIEENVNEPIQEFIDDAIEGTKGLFNDLVNKFARSGSPSHKKNQPTNKAGSEQAKNKKKQAKAESKENKRQSKEDNRLNKKNKKADKERADIKKYLEELTKPRTETDPIQPAPLKPPTK